MNSDFETFRPTDSSDGPFTKNTSNKLYCSPEQYRCEDLTTFGLIIFLYERKDIHSLYRKCDIKDMNEGLSIVHYIYKQCVQNEQGF